MLLTASSSPVLCAAAPLPVTTCSCVIMKLHQPLVQSSGIAAAHLEQPHRFGHLVHCCWRGNRHTPTSPIDSCPTSFLS
jgi:hypothetical protein